jgi:hypothetical protein
MNLKGVLMADEKINIIGPVGREGPSGREGPPGREGIIGRTGLTGAEGPTGAEGSPGEPGVPGMRGVHGVEGLRGIAGINSINSITRFQYLMMMVVFWIACTAFIVMLAAPIFVFGYPFKTVDIVEPIRVLNPGNRVPIGGIVEMQVHFVKYTNEPGVIVATLVRKERDELIPIDSFTWISNRGASSGSHNRRFPINSTNSLAIGKNCFIIFSVHYELWGIRPITRQFESEPFEIYKP